MTITYSPDTGLVILYNPDDGLTADIVQAVRTAAQTAYANRMETP